MYSSTKIIEKNAEFIWRNFIFKFRKLITFVMWIQRLDRQTLIMKVGNQIQFSRGNGGKQKYEKEGKSVLKNQLRNYPSKHRHQFQENSFKIEGVIPYCKFLAFDGKL